ncbi:MAG: hypothetical protein Q8P41_29940 [Pseudomonadota bacterium]|nr:hypothetical protein [Pseudomonadota bacterium]
MNVSILSKRLLSLLLLSAVFFAPRVNAGAFVEVAAGSFFSCGRLDDGTVRCWGGPYEVNNPMRAGQPVRAQPTGSWRSIRAAGDALCAVSATNELQCWGQRAHWIGGPVAVDWTSFEIVEMSDARGVVCGIQPDRSMGCVAGGVLDLPPKGVPGRYREVKPSEGGDLCGLTEDGLVACLDGGSMRPRFDEKVRDVSLSDGFGCAATEPAGDIVCFGQEQDGRTRPPAGAYRALDGASFTCGIREDGALRCWGPDSREDEPQRLLPPVGVYRQVAVGLGHACGLRESGDIVCWGQGSQGQTGVPRVVVWDPAMLESAGELLETEWRTTGATYMPAARVKKTFEGRDGRWRTETTAPPSEYFRMPDFPPTAGAVMTEAGQTGVGVTERVARLYALEGRAWTLLAAAGPGGFETPIEPVTVLPDHLAPGETFRNAVGTQQVIPGAGLVETWRPRVSTEPVEVEILSVAELVRLPSNIGFNYATSARMKWADGSEWTVFFAPGLGEIGRKDAKGEWVEWLKEAQRPKTLRVGFAPTNPAEIASSCPNKEACVGEATARLAEERSIGAAVSLERACGFDPDGCGVLAGAIATGKVSSDYATAGRAYAKACASSGQWCEPAAAFLKVLARDSSAAAAAYGRAMDQGSQEARGALADLYATGQGVSLDPLRAYSLHLDACASERANSCISAAQLVQDGLVGPPDREAVLRLLSLACNAGSQDACARVPPSTLQEAVERHDAMVEQLQRGDARK